jgi:hypothetical protein
MNSIINYVVFIATVCILLFTSSLIYGGEEEETIKFVEPKAKDHTHEIVVVMPDSYYDIIAINEQLVAIIRQYQYELGKCQSKIIEH